MRNKKEISESEFLSYVDPSNVLDEGETWSEYRNNMIRQDEVKYYRSDGVYFFKTAGFEFFWGE